MDDKVIITRDTGGYDITCILAGEIKHRAWKVFHREASSLAYEWASYYRDMVGQCLTIIDNTARP